MILQSFTCKITIIFYSVGWAWLQSSYSLNKFDEFNYGRQYFLQILSCASKGKETCLPNNYENNSLGAS